MSSCSAKSVEVNIYNAVSDNWKIYDNVDKNSFINNLNKRASFEIKSVEKQDGVYVVNLDVTAPDISIKLKEYQDTINFIPSDNEINEKLKSIIDSAELKTTQQTVMVLVTDDGMYNVEFSSGFVDAMCGYSYQYYLEQMEELLKGEQ